MHLNSSRTSAHSIWHFLACLAMVAPVACGHGLRSPSTMTSIQDLQILGTAETFAVLGGQTVTNTGPTVVSGNLGVSPGTAITGFPPGIVINGTTYAGDAVALQAQSDNAAAYITLAGEACNHDLTTTPDLAGLTLTPGVSCFASSALLSGTLTLDAQGDPNAVFIFQIGSTLTTASNSHVLLINEGRGCDVFWQVGSSATIGTASTFVGNILALTSISLGTGASIDGRALAQNGSVKLDTNQLSFERCTTVTDGGSGGTSGTTGGTTSTTGGTTSTTGGSGGTAGSDGGSCSGTLCACGCVDLNSDAKNCGACGHECAYGESCNAGACAPLCDGMHSFCGGACIDPLTDSNNCGMCGNVCAPEVPCSAGYCGACPGAVCGSWCVDLGSDRNDCGRCGNACAATETCSAGSCRECAEAVCGNSCVDLLTDPNDCGGCSVACAANQSCLSGRCGQSCGGP